MQNLRCIWKKLFGFLLLLLLLECVPPERLPYSDQVIQPLETAFYGHKRLIAVMDFENKTAEGGPQIGSAAADKLVSYLAKTNRFILVERQRLAAILNEQALMQAGVITEESGAAAGKMLGVQGLILGSVLEFNQHAESGSIGDKEDKWHFKLKAAFAKVTIEYRLVDSITGEVIFSDQISRQKLKPAFGLKTEEFDFTNLFEIDQTLIGKALNEVVTEMGNKLAAGAEKITWYGKVIRVRNDLIYFTPGKSAGIELNELFEIQSRDEVNYPANTPKKIIKVIGFLQDKLSKANLIQGESVARGDWVLEHQPETASKENQEF